MVNSPDVQHPRKKTAAQTAKPTKNERIPPMSQPTPHIRLTPLLMILLSLFVLAVQGCFHSSGGGGSGTSNADPTGYYDVSGTASVSDGNGGALTITDLQGMVNGNRFIAISDANGLVYDGMITDINGNDFTAAVTVFQDGSPITTTTVTGMITAGAKITGTVAGSDLGSGAFELIYASSNNTAAVLSRVQNMPGFFWFDRVGGGQATGLGFAVDGIGNVTHFFSANDAIFNQCVVASGTISPVTGTSLYTINMTLSNCNSTDVDGIYAGLTSMRTESIESPIGDRLVLVVSKSNFSVQGEFKLGEDG